MFRRQYFLQWCAASVFVFSFFLQPIVVSAAGGADCQAQGEVAYCATETECSGMSGMESIGEYDCSELNTVSGGTSDNTYICCRQLEGTTSNVPTQEPVSSPPGYSNFRLQLPSCISNGKCQLDDIVLTGVAFANLLMTLSGAFFFATFVYGGGMYVLSFGRADFVKKGTHAMTNAAIGMIIVLSAWTIVNYVASSLLGKI